MPADTFSTGSTAGKEIGKLYAPQCSSACTREALESLAESMQSIHLFSYIIKTLGVARVSGLTDSGIQNLQQSRGIS